MKDSRLIDSMKASTGQFDAALTLKILVPALNKIAPDGRMNVPTPLAKKDTCSVYQVPPLKPAEVKCYIASTPETRAICNDPFVYGVQYTRALQRACTRILATLADKKEISLNENHTTVLNILRGGLNFGLRDALADAFNWNKHTAAFISAQRARREPDPETWYITENNYRKVFLPADSAIVFGDVVATGTSLEFALQSLLEIAHESGSRVNRLIFFTIGGPRSEEVLAGADAACRGMFPGFAGSSVIYLEGRFAVAEKDTPIAIKISGTDLLRCNSDLAPEFIASQYENPAYPLERCTIYDAGSRSFWIPEYIEDVRDYWSQMQSLAKSGYTFETALSERFPELDAAQFGKIDLADLSARQIAKTHLNE